MNTFICTLINIKYIDNIKITYCNCELQYRANVTNLLEKDKIKLIKMKLNKMEQVEKNFLR